MRNNEITSFLLAFESVNPSYGVGIGLVSDDEGATFTWTTGVSQPMTEGENGWAHLNPRPPAFGTIDLYCAVIAGIGINNWDCNETFYGYCCMLPKMLEL